MKKYYEILGLKQGATKQDIKKAFNKLSKELDPKKNDNQDFFIEETKKLKEAYDKLMNSSILSTKKLLDKSNKKEDKASNETNSVKPDSNPKKKSFFSKDFAFGILLFFIATGVWGIFLQNMGLITTEDFTQKVRVVNTVDVDGSVRVDGGNISVNGEVEAYVNNTVEVSINEVLAKDGKKYYYIQNR
jgi:DnaJ-class molecular chaperone